MKYASVPSSNTPWLARKGEHLSHSLVASRSLRVQFAQSNVASCSVNVRLLYLGIKREAKCGDKYWQKVEKIEEIVHMV